MVYNTAAKNGETHDVDAHIVEEYIQQEAQVLPQAIPDGAAKALMHVLRLAVATAKPPFIMVALATVQQVVAAGYIQGEVSSLILDGEGRGGVEQPGMVARGLSMTPERLGVAAQSLHLVCACEDCCSDEEVEVLNKSASFLTLPACGSLHCNIIAWAAVSSPAVTATASPAVYAWVFLVEALPRSIQDGSHNFL